MLPLFVRGSVVSGFGRGSKELGIPTANLPDEVVAKLPINIKNGIYFGFASVQPGRNNGLILNHSDIKIYPAVISIGWNPFYKNVKRTLEVHLLKVFSQDFYGSELRVCLADYIREEKNFPSVDELISAIENDIAYSKKKVQEPSYEQLRSHSFFVEHQVSKEPFFLNDK